MKPIPLIPSRGRRWRCLQLLLFSTILVVAATSTVPALGQVGLLIPLANANWRYQDTGRDQGTNWRARVFAEESTWPIGVSFFGRETTTPYPYPAPIRTDLPLGGGRITYYFRHRFTFPQNPAGVLLFATNYVDDGAVFYLNGSEVGRIRMPAGPVSFNTRAQVAFPEGVAVVLNFPSSSLVAGDNVLAVEVHQNSDTSPDVVFGMSLGWTASVPPAFVSPDEPSDRSVAQGQSTTLRVSATGVPTPTLQWRKGGVPIPGATTDTLVLHNAMAGDGGNYSVLASNSAGIAISRTAVVTYVPDTTPPAMLYALGRENLTEVLVAFSEIPDLDEAEDTFNWCLEEIESGGMLTVQRAQLVNSTNVLLTTEQPRETSLRYRVSVVGIGISDLYGNRLDPGTTIRLVSYPTNLVEPGGSQIWRYAASETDPGTAWRGVGYADGAWAAGEAPFDALRSGTSACRPGPLPTGDAVGTCISMSNALNSAQVPSLRFRTLFNFTGNPTNVVLRLRALVDDGAVFYLNGTEIYRFNLPEGSIAYSTLASLGISDPTWRTEDLPWTGLRNGMNTLAVEVHQDSLTSADLTFALRLTAIVPPPVAKPPPPPQMTITNSAGQIILQWNPGLGTLQEADDIIGPWVNVSASHPPNEHRTFPFAERKFYRVVVP